MFVALSGPMVLAGDTDLEGELNAYASTSFASPAPPVGRLRPSTPALRPFLKPKAFRALACALVGWMACTEANAKDPRLTHRRPSESVPRGLRRQRGIAPHRPALPVTSGAGFRMAS